MSMPFYVAPEQVMKDRADYARKGIARGRSLVAARCTEGIVICAENPSSTLRKVSEIYDRIAFAGVGKYNEFDQLRISGVRAADLKGYSFSREDVDARSLANQYAQILGQIFTHEMKPLEVEILVAEVGADASERPAVPPPLRRHGHRRGRHLGAGRRRRGHRRAPGAGAARRPATCRPRSSAAVGALAGPDRTLGPAELEVAVLERAGARRCFRRLARRRGGHPPRRRTRHRAVAFQGLHPCTGDRSCASPFLAPPRGRIAGVRQRLRRLGRQRQLRRHEHHHRCGQGDHHHRGGGRASTSTSGRPTSAATSAPGSRTSRRPAARWPTR